MQLKIYFYTKPFRPKKKWENKPSTETNQLQYYEFIKVVRKKIKQKFHSGITNSKLTWNYVGLKSNIVSSENWN